MAGTTAGAIMAAGTMAGGTTSAMQGTIDIGPQLAALRKLCLPYPQAEEYIMVHHPAFRVGKKPFAIVGDYQECTLAVKVPKEEQHVYLEDPRFSKTPYIGQHGWVTVSLEKMKDDEVRRLIDISYRGVAPKKALAQLAAK